MFQHIFLFEFRYRARRPATWVYLGVMILVGFFYGSILGGAFGPEVTGILMQGGKVDADAPYLLHQLIFSLAQVPGTFIIAAFMAVPVYRDFQYRSHELFFTRPIGKNVYLTARFLASFLLTIGVMLGLSIGFILSRYNPAVIETNYGPLQLSHYFYPFLTSVIPFIFIAGTIFFTTLTLTRTSLFIYLNAILLLVLFSVASSAAGQIDNKTVAALLDPTGGQAFVQATEYWTPTERNTQLVSLTRNMALNLAIWVGVGLVILGTCYRFFSFTYVRDGGKAGKSVPAPRRRKRRLGHAATQVKLALPKVAQAFSLRHNFRLMGRLFRKEAGDILRSPVFLIIAAVGVLFMVLSFTFANLTFGTPTLPVTYSVMETIMGSMTLFILVLVVFYTGELVWKERSMEMEGIFDALPIPNWVSLAAKWLAIAVMPFLLMTLGILVGIIYQLVSGYTRIEPGLYIEYLLGYQMIDTLLFLCLAFFVQVLSPSKYLGFFLTVILFFFNGLGLDLLNVEDRLFRYMSNTPLPYSDMNGFGHFVGPFLTFKLYWTGMAIILMALTNALWVRGSVSSARQRLSDLRQRMRPATWATLAVGLVIFLGTGSYIYYNTHVLNEYVTSKESQALQAEYEKTYSRFEGIPQPRILGMNIGVDLYPETRDFDLRGTYYLQNKTTQPLDSIHIMLYDDVDYGPMRFDRTVDTVLADERMGYYIYQLRQPLQPGDSLTLSFEGQFRTQGFPNRGFNTQVVYNGTFINHGYFPIIGYERNYELQDPDLREKYELGERERFPPITDTLARMNTLFAHDADWVDFEATVSTAPNQIAVTPGYLQREWEENGRRYFHYKMDAPMAKFFNIVSADYEVMRDTWQAPDGREIKLEIYHHIDHTYNLDRMMDGIKAALAYYTESFGPYQHRQVRILEFPRYMSFAQSFANTIPFSESVGFIADVDEDDVDYTYYITAHEVAHQWWAHQVAGGAVQGFQFLSETMSQYASLMVMEKTYGQEGIKKYLRYEMDNYLRQRSGERYREMPALLSENQLYIHYNKGSVIMYALKDYIGEDSLNAAMKRYVEAVRFQEPPYTTTEEWLRYVEAVTPDSLRYVLTDMFETITLFDNRLAEATYSEADGRYKVRLKVATKKLRDDGKGVETEVPVDDYIDIGIFGEAEKRGEDPPVLYLQKHHLTADTTEIEVWVDEKPDEAGLDPYYKLIDRKPGDNTGRVKPLDE
ncbi:MAG: hypothetical protein D6722_05105 [Bacteroidetes bacterium]|nr:MAG: hypothetical protein D6722_05105 [Bacteroidota bacterium]